MQITMNDREDITNFYQRIARKKPVVSIGGDHSITGGILKV